MSKQKENTEPGFHLYKRVPRLSSARTVFYWHFISKNGRVVAKSVTDHTTKLGAIQSIKCVLNILDAGDRSLYYDHTMSKKKTDVPDLFVIK
jgi:hypothetical protein